MTRKVTLSYEQRDALDWRVLRAIREGAVKSADIEAAIYVSDLPCGKTAMRYIDGALQRLSKQGRIKHRKGCGWTISKVRR